MDSTEFLNDVAAGLIVEETTLDDWNVCAFRLTLHSPGRSVRPAAARRAATRAWHARTLYWWWLVAALLALALN